MKSVCFSNYFLSRSNLSDLQRQHLHEGIIVYGQGLSHRSHFTHLQVSYLISQKLKIGSGFRGWREMQVINELLDKAWNIYQKILLVLNRG